MTLHREVSQTPGLRHKERLYHFSHQTRGHWLPSNRTARVHGESPRLEKHQVQSWVSKPPAGEAKSPSSPPSPQRMLPPSQAQRASGTLRRSYSQSVAEAGPKLISPGGGFPPGSRRSQAGETLSISLHLYKASQLSHTCAECGWRATLHPQRPCFRRRPALPTGCRSSLPIDSRHVVRAVLCWRTEMAPQEDVHLRRNFLEGRAVLRKNTLPG